IAFVLALAMVVTMLPAKAVSAASSDAPDMYKTLRLYLDSGNGITENSDLTGAFQNERYASVWGWRENGYDKVEFASEDPEIATVSSKGKVTAVKVGTTTVTATFTGEGVKTVVKECKVTVKRNAAKVGLSADSAKQVEAGFSVGEKVQLTAVRKDAEGKTEWNKTMRDYTTDSLRFKSSNEEVFKVTKTTGMITATGAGEATLTIWAVQSEGFDADAKEYPAGASKEYKVVVSGFAAQATGVKEITVTGAFTKDSKFEVKKGNQNIAFTATVAEDGRSAVLALATKLNKGVYTVSCGDLKAEIVAEDEKVVQINVLENGGQVTTNANRTQIFVHYDVLNQYGESVRKNYEVQWTSSTGGTVIKNNKENGILTIGAGRNLTDTITYGTAIILTGVHTATGNVATVTANLTAGLENCVSGVEVAGVTKENSNELLKELPAGFVDGEYLLVYKMLDRLGYAMDYSDAEALNLTFTSLSPLLIASISNATGADLVQNGVVIDGVQYGAVRLHRGLDTKKGGTARIQITSTKTGTSTPYELKIVSEQVLDSFQIIAPDSVVAENDGTITLRYEAYDTEGAPVTDFRALYKSLSFSDDGLRLVENNDGSATLRYKVPLVNAAEGIDVPQIYTTTIPATGKSSIVQINIKANAKAAAVKGYEGNANILEGASVDVLSVNNWSGKPYLTWYDQYDREIDGATNRIPAGYFVAVKYTGTALTFGTAVANLTDADPSYQYFNSTITVNATPNSTNSILPQTVEFALADTTGKIVSGSERKVVLNVVDIKQCSSFYITNEWSGKAFNGSDSIGFHVTGKLANGSEVAIPNDSKYIEYVTSSSAAGFTSVTGSAITVSPNLDVTADENGNTQFSNQSVTNANGTHPNRFLEIKVEASLFTEDKALKDYASTKIEVGVDPKKVVSFTLKDTWQSYWINADAADAKAYVNATEGNITYIDLIKFLGSAVTNYDNYSDIWGTDWTTRKVVVNVPVKITVSKLMEGSKGIKTDSLLVDRNATILSSDTIIKGAEIGDTFIATYEYQNATITIQFTVGADTTAEYSSTSDTCNWR
ncbi:MAG: Ig-like domain-containing protein, partial [Lachnospiraceae bacterium]|nr:Ig-like domain-containing protein [Lachnospiraceae bacterium]